MPELPVKEVRLPELHLPEFDREQIVRSLSAISLPMLQRPKVEALTPERSGLRERLDVRAIDWRAIGSMPIDLGRAAGGVAALTRVGRPVLGRPRLTLALGAVLVAGIAAAALVAKPDVRERAGRMVRGVRGRVLDRTAGPDRLEVDEDVIASSVSADPAPLDDVPAPEEVSSPA